MRRTSYIIPFAFIIVTIISCEKAEVITQQELIENYIADRMDESRVKFWKDCSSNTIKDAEAYVDSIIFRQVNFNVGDTVQTPGKPIKPTRPFDTLELDSTPVIPILIDSSEIK